MVLKALCTHEHGSNARIHTVVSSMKRMCCAIAPAVPLAFLVGSSGVNICASRDRVPRPSRVQQLPPGCSGCSGAFPVRFCRKLVKDLTLSQESSLLVHIQFHLPSRERIDGECRHQTFYVGKKAKLHIQGARSARKRLWTGYTLGVPGKKLLPHYRPPAQARKAE